MISSTIRFHIVFLNIRPSSMLSTQKIQGKYVTLEYIDCIFVPINLFPLIIIFKTTGKGGSCKIQIIEQESSRMADVKIYQWKDM